MRIEDREPFAQMLAATFELYGKEISESVLMVWWSSMERFDLDVVREALSRHVLNPDSGQYLPKPADVVRELQGSKIDRALVASAELLRAVQSVGAWESVSFLDPIINKVVSEMGGWPSFCECKIDEWPFKSREFEARYRVYAARGGVSDPPTSLPGRFAQINNAAGHEPPSVVRIGEGKGNDLLVDGSCNDSASVEQRFAE